MIPRRFLTVFVFLTGTAITAIEITASRALAPYFGTSIFVWANVIGVVLIALALGYRIGGRMADQHPHPVRLYSLVLVAGVYSALIPLLVQLVARSITAPFTATGIQYAVVYASFLATTILFFPPVFLLGMVSPYALRLAEARTEESGHVAGALYAASTLGSIVGIFLPAFFLIPFVGVRETFLLASITLIILASLRLVRGKPWVPLFLLVPIVVYMLLTTFTPSPRLGSRIVDERDSLYQHILVTQNPAGEYELRINDGIGLQSVYHPDRVLFRSYFDYYAVLPYLLPERRELKVLLLGLAGGTISRQYELLLRDDFDLHIDGVEIDPEVVEIARKYFALDQPSLTVHVADGRTFLQQSQERYDLILVDAYSQQIYIPPHMTTQEFFAETRAHLVPDGILTINVNAFRDDAELLQRVVLTLASVYPDVRLTRLPDLANILVFAGNAPPAQALLAERVPQELISNALVVEQAVPQTFVASPRRILTDNRAPVELLTESMIFDILFHDRTS